MSARRRPRTVYAEALFALAPALLTGGCGAKCPECYHCLGCAEDPPYCKTHPKLRAAQKAAGVRRRPAWRESREGRRWLGR